MPALGKGGAERVVVDLLLNLDRSVYEPILILFKEGGEWIAELTAENIPVVILKKTKKIDLFNFWKILKTLKKFRPQIVHTHLGGDFYGRLAAKIINTPLILSTEHNINKDENIIFSFFKQLAIKISGKKVVAVSEAVKKDAISRYNLKSENITVILNGVEVDKFLKMAKNHQNNSKEINKHQTVFYGTMGRLSPQKGHLILLETWKNLKNEADCSIAGTGPLKRALIQKIKEENLENKVKLIGPVSDPAAFLNSLDAFIFPSIWEGLGIVLLEAGLIGLPIIASEVDGITEIINNNNGWLVPAKNPKALADKIDWLSANLDNELVIAKTEKLRNDIINNFDIKKITEKYQELYQKLLLSEK